MAVTHEITSRLFPNGTTLGLYDAEGYVTFPPNGPPGSALAEVTVEGHSAKFTELTENHPYFAAAKVSGEWRYVKLIAGAENPPDWHGSGVSKGELSAEQKAREDADSAHAADTTNVHGIADTSALATSASVTAEEAARKNADEAQDTTRSASGKGYVNHGEEAAKARPTGYASVEWYGSVEPENAQAGDTWIVEA